MEECLGLFARYGVREVVTSSPHCLYTFRNEYPAFQSQIYSDQGLKFFARHYTELLSDLLVNGLIRFEIPFRKRVTYHDPCYLGRYNRIFDAPRAVITAIPGIDFVEMAHHREYSLCCGGGGGRMWQEGLDAETKMSEIRIKEAHTAGAEVVITACPLCLIMLEDARKTAELEESLEVMDLNELVVMALGIEECSK
jgi:Fe-S oxidoreductase